MGKIKYTLASSSFAKFFVINMFQGNRYEQEKLLKQSNTLYVGNLSFYTTEEQVRRLIKIQH